jgi:hypothetical protein
VKNALDEPPNRGLGLRPIDRHRKSAHAALPRFCLSANAGSRPHIQVAFTMLAKALSLD